MRYPIFSPSLRLILNEAEELRHHLGYKNGPVDVVMFVETVCLQRGVIFSIEDEILDGNGVPLEAEVRCGSDPVLLVRSSVYDGAIKGHPADRFTFAHELGHIVRHVQEYSDTKRLGRGRPTSGHSFKANRLQEIEANEFAGAFMLPLASVSQGTTLRSVMEDFGMSKMAAEHALQRVRAVHTEKWRAG